MERGPLMEVLSEMIGTDKELSIVLWGEDKPIEIRNVEFVEQLTSTQGILVKTKSNNIWLDSSHVSAAWQARNDL
ncbi:MAG: hypothetical protein VX436_03820 [Planctomycetota bacterium]|nr:hypothetical protein [Planctomycetota bacterium]|tara:strand:- start:111 stop:335 length:225 start_codon:yes stop_codon:yes gene_type:complete